MDAYVGPILFLMAVFVAFGLLHGIGFASGLTLTGVPRSEIPSDRFWFRFGPGPESPCPA